MPNYTQIQEVRLNHLDNLRCCYPLLKYCQWLSFLCLISVYFITALESQGEKNKDDVLPPESQGEKNSIEDVYRATNYQCRQV